MANNDRLGDIIDLLIEFGNGNFEKKGIVNDEDDPFNAVMSGLNMLGEELTHYKKELEQQNNFLQNIMTNLDEVIYVRDINHDSRYTSPFTFVSKRSENVIGFSQKQLTNNPSLWMQSIHSDDQPNVTDTISKILAGEDDVLIYRLYNPILKEYRWMEDRTTTVKGADGKVAQVYGSVRDITERKKNMLELQDKNTLISRIISSSDQLFYVVLLDPEKPFANNFSFLSQQAEKIQGSTIEEIKQQPFGWIKAIHPDDVEDVKKVTRTMFSTKKPVTRLYRIMHAKTGEYIWLEDYVVPVADSNGCIKELFGSARDVTMRMNTAQEREQLIKELSDRYNESMQFNYIVSHNLRAPVAHIIGLAKLLNSDLPEKDKKDTTDYILEATESLDELLKDLNTILSARSMLNEKIENFKLKRIIKTVCSNLRKPINDTDAEIIVQVADDANDMVSIKSYIQSALFNLISNAIKYRSKDRKPVITIDAQVLKDNTVITVSDNGSGIDLELNKDKIFGLYNRFHPEHEGKGLGLYMTKTQIESLDGTITVDSKVGEGTTFTIIL